MKAIGFRRIVCTLFWLVAIAALPAGQAAGQCQGSGPIDVSITHFTLAEVVDKDAVVSGESLPGTREWAFNMWNHAGEWGTEQYPYFVFTNPRIAVPGTSLAVAGAVLEPGAPGFGTRLTESYTLVPGYDVLREVSPAVVPAHSTVTQFVTVTVTLRDHARYDISESTTVFHAILHVQIGPFGSSVSFDQSKPNLDVDTPYTFTTTVLAVNDSDTAIISKPYVQVGAQNYHQPTCSVGSTTTILDDSLAVVLGAGASQGVFSVDETDAEFHPRLPDEGDVIIFAASQQPASDTTPPVVTSVTASPGVLWPPNHKMVSIALGATATDDVTAMPVCRVVSVTCNQALNGAGDGNTAGDWSFSGAGLDLSLRAERAGNLADRIYTVGVQCRDDAGNDSAPHYVTVIVPHDQRKK